jgi:transposase
MGRFVPIIHQILEDDRQAPRKQRHTAMRIWQRLHAEHDFGGCYTSVKDVVRDWRQARREVFLPLSHPPGEAQVDFGEATVRLSGEPTKVALFVMTLPYSCQCALDNRPVVSAKTGQGSESSSWA